MDESSRGGGSGRKLASHFDTDPRQLAGQTAQTVDALNQRVPGLLHDKTHVFHSVEDLLNSDYAKQHPFSKEDLAGLQNAEGFHDPKTGHSAIIAGNVELRPGETPHDALTRVILHERVGHDGLQALLGSKDSKAQKHWEGLTQRIRPSAFVSLITLPKCRRTRVVASFGNNFGRHATVLRMSAAFYRTTAQKTSRLQGFR